VVERESFDRILVNSAAGPAEAPVGFIRDYGANQQVSLWGRPFWSAGEIQLANSMRYLLGVGFILAGLLHFLRTSTYMRAIPPALGHAEALVYISGVCEIAGGIGVMIARTRRPAGIGLIALLIAVFPANLYMAMHPQLFADIASQTTLLWRLPVQAVLIAWVWWCCF